MKILKLISLLVIMLLLQSCASMYLKKGNEAHGNLKYQDAIRLLEKGLRKKEDYASRKNLADAYYRLSDFSSASKHYESAILDSKFSDEDRINYGRSLISNGDTEKAGEIFSGLISRTANNESLYSLRQAAFSQDKIKRDSARFAVKKENIGGVVNVSSPIPYKDGFLVTAQSKKGKKDPYNGLSYNNLLFTKKTNDAWSTPSSIGKINGPYHDAYAAISPDGRTMIFTRSNTEDNKLKKDEKETSNTLLYIREMGENGEWGNVSVLPFCKEQFMYAHPAFSPDGQNLLFASNMPGSLGGMDLFVTEKTENGWSTPANMGSDLNTFGEDVFPYFKNADTLFFSTNGRLTLGGLDIHQVSKRNGSWTKTKHLGYPINSFADDFGVYFSTPSTGYLSSNREGNDALYSFVISSSLYLLNGLVVDKTSMSPLANVKIIIQNLTDGSEELDYTDEKGAFTFEFEAGNKYKIIAEKEDYFNLSKQFDITENTKSDDLKSVFELEKLIISDVADKTKDPNNNGTDPQKDGTTGGNKDGNGEKNDKDGKDGKNGKNGKNGQDTDGTSKDGKDSNDTKGKDGKNKDGKGDKSTNEKEYPYAVPRIFWDYNDANIRPDAIPYLEDLVKLFTDNPGLKVEIRSHCDSRGSDLYNDALSQQRADALVAYLKDRGVNTKKFTSKGIGKRKLINKCTEDVNCSEAEHQENRRSEFLILSK